jgi:hypothetical protein
MLNAEVVAAWYLLERETLKVNIRPNSLQYGTPAAKGQAGRCATCYFTLGSFALLRKHSIGHC